MVTNALGKQVLLFPKIRWMLVSRSLFGRDRETSQ
jgi:hypothetical protein